jgi:hypothetical protein
LGELKNLRSPVARNVKIVQAATLLASQLDEIEQDGNYENNAHDQRGCHSFFLSVPEPNASG